MGLYLSATKKAPEMMSIQVLGPNLGVAAVWMDLRSSSFFKEKGVEINADEDEEGMRRAAKRASILLLLLWLSVTHEVGRVCVYAFFLNFHKITSEMLIKPTSSSFVKYAALAVLVLQNAFLVLLMRASQLPPTITTENHQQVKYLASTAVLFGEVIKFGVSAIFLLVETSAAGNVKNPVSTTLRLIASNVNWQTMRSDFPSLSIPALLYLVQNNFVYIAAYNLEPAPFQLLFQLKIFSTALLSMFILKKVLTLMHWRALFVLFIGVGFVQLSTMQSASTTSPINNRDEDPIKGLFAIAIAVLCSGLSGVWFEKILKSTPSSIWIRNIQLAMISFCLACASIVLQPLDFQQVKQHGVFAGYSALVWSVIIIQSLGGLLVAVVVKYADNILKGFATSIATVLSTLVSVMWFDFRLTPLFMCGAALVLGSAVLYNTADQAPPSRVTTQGI